MQLMRPIIWMSRNAGQDPDSPVKDFRPANTLDPAVVEQAPVVEVTLAAEPEGDPDPKVSSVPGSASTSSDDENEKEPSIPSSPEPEEPHADAAKAKLLHPSSVKTGKPEQPVAA